LNERRQPAPDTGQQADGQPPARASCLSETEHRSQHCAGDCASGEHEVALGREGGGKNEHGPPPEATDRHRVGDRCRADEPDEPDVGVPDRIQSECRVFGEYGEDDGHYCYRCRPAACRPRSFHCQGDTRSAQDRRAPQGALGVVEMDGDCQEPEQQRTRVVYRVTRGGREPGVELTDQGGVG
jgi:hypothetical protein